MKPIGAVAFLVGLGCVAAATIWWREAAQPAAPDATPRAHTARGGEKHLTVATTEAAPREAPRKESAVGEGATHAGDEPARWRRGRSAGTDPRVPSFGSWPVSIAHRRTSRTGAASAEAIGSPTVPTKIAFRALWYLGTDPEAEKTWRRAINDPNHPPGVRSDLIVDMIDEGYTDNNHPTKEDLPVILARLELIERHAPYAMDEVNAEAFEVAYRHLLDMYIRLGGEPRDKR